MNFLEAYLALDKLQEWKLMNSPVSPTPSASSPPPASSAQPAAVKASPKTYQITYYDDGVKKTFTVTAGSRYEAEQIAWSKLDADSLYVDELGEELDLDEARRVIHDADILYHYTNPTPFFKIFTEDCLKSDVKLNAVCFTTDKDYHIYGYPCGIQFSRKRLEADGYDLTQFDEYADNTEAAGESEERIYEDIDNVSKYVTAVHIYWQGRDGAEISIVQSAEGDRIGDATYNEYGEEYEGYDLMLSDFMAVLKSLRSKGIKVVEYGTPMSGQYYLDAEGKFKYGQLPMSAVS